MPGVRRWSALDAVAGAYAAVYFGCLAARALGYHADLELAVAFYPLGLALAWLDWRNSTLPDLDARTRLAWRLLAVGALLLWVTGSLWTYLVDQLGQSVLADMASRATALEYVVALAAYFSFPGRPVPRKHRVRFAFDVIFIVAAAGAIAAYMGFKIARHTTAEPTTILVVETAVEAGIFVIAAVGCMQKRDPIVRRALVLLLTAGLASTVGDYAMALTPRYQPGNPIDGFWFAAWVLRWVAARWAWYRYRERGEATPDPDDDQSMYRGNPFAFALVTGAFVVLFVQIVAEDTEMLEGMTIMAMGMGGLLMLRQFIELQENRKLVRAQVERESLFSRLVANSSDLMLLVDASGIVTYVSPSVTRILGPDSKLEVGAKLQDLVTVDVAARLPAHLTASAESPRAEARIEVSPGRWREIEAVWSDLRDDPALNAFVVNCRDVTERNEIERHLRQTQKLEAMGHLAGGLAHDLNNVLAIIRGYTELLGCDLEEPRLTADLDQIVKAVDRATGITQKVLAFSRKQPGHLTMFDLAAVVGGVGPMLRQLMTDEVEVRMTFAPGLWPVRADQGQFEQVVVNLCTNARDAMPHGGVIEIDASNETLTGNEPGRAGVRAGDYVALKVRDHGAGMPEAVASRVFEPFFSTKPKDRGLGLGLAIVHGIVTDADGHVFVESVEGQGSTFTILLPRAVDMSAPPDALPQPPPAA